MAVQVVPEASSSISRCTYHVFLSFRGADTRKNFTDHLYTALVQARIHTFRDDEEIEKGENISDEIEKTILHKSKLSIIVFSKDYASSTWCLNELVMILEHKKSSQHIVLPIFYDVDPTQIRNQTRSYAKAFARHEESFKSEMEKVERWRAALKEIADLGGMVLQDRYESQFIQDIVQEVQKKVHGTALCVPPYLVGIDFIVTCISWWLDVSNKVGIATICGIGGIGKTTIAKVVYNQNIQRFEGYSFLADVREVSQERNGLVRLQRQLLSDILKGKVNKIYNVDDGIRKIEEALCCRKVLVVLDDVDDSEKIAKIIGTQAPLHPGSKIIITSRHRDLLNVPFVGQILNLEPSSNNGDICMEFEIKELPFDQSLQLFNWYAFGEGYPNESSMENARNIVKLCGGLPLALRVLGSSLSGKSKSVWESSLKKLEAIPNSKIQKILRISYDSLEDDHDKNLFLDIVCLFIGKDIDYTTTILDGCDFYTTIGIENLISRSLLFVNEKNKLMMHQMIRDMGKEIIRQESPNLGKRSRLWHKEAFNVIREKIGTKTIKCLSIDLQKWLEDMYGKTAANLHLLNQSKNPFLLSNKVDMEIEAFTKMQKLKLLQLDYGKLKGDYRDFPNGLIWLHWHGFPLQYIPTDLDISRLVVLDMRKSNLKHFWLDKKCLPNLKILNLSHSHGLLKTPNFSGLLSLEKLMLKNCIKLIEVDQSIGELKALNLLNLKGCKNLRKFPSTIGRLISLEVLILSGCSRLDHVPKELQSMGSLKVLELDEIAINESNSWFSWPSLKRTELSLFWASLPSSLVKLSLENCRLFDDVMPNDLRNLVSLKYLNLSRNTFRSLPKSISSLTTLDELILTSCKELQSLPKLPNLSGLRVKIFQSADRVSSLSYILSSKRCIIIGCEKLTEVEGVFKLEPVENFEVEHIKSLFHVDSFGSNKVQIYNYLTCTIIVASSQVFHEFGKTSCFVPGSEVPLSFRHRSKGSKISFSLPPHDIHCEKMISWLNLCIVFSLVNNQTPEHPPCVTIFNDSKEAKFGYYSSFIGIPESNNDTMLWLIHWPVVGGKLKGGDNVSCVVLSTLDVREIGVTHKSGSNIPSHCDLQQSYQGNEDIPRYFDFDLIEDHLNLGCSADVKVQRCNLLKESESAASPQVLYDIGIINPFDLSNEIPMGGHHPRTMGPKCSFTVPPNSSPKIISWLKWIIVLSCDCDKIVHLIPHIEIVNETKGIKWTYCKHFIQIPEAKSTIYWISSWKFTGELKGGDHVSFTVFSDFCVKNCVIHLLYESDENHLFETNCCDSNYANRYLDGRKRRSRGSLALIQYNVFKSQKSLDGIQRS